MWEGWGLKCPTVKRWWCMSQKQDRSDFRRSRENCWSNTGIQHQSHQGRCETISSLRFLSLIAEDAASTATHPIFDYRGKAGTSVWELANFYLLSTNSYFVILAILAFILVFFFFFFFLFFFFFPFFPMKAIIFPGGIQGQAGCGSGQPGLVVGDPAHSKGLKLDNLWCPFQPRPFYDSVTFKYLWQNYLG